MQMLFYTIKQPVSCWELNEAHVELADSHAAAGLYILAETGPDRKFLVFSQVYLLIPRAGKNLDAECVNSEFPGIFLW